MNGKRIGRLMQVMGLEVLYCRPKTSVSDPTHKLYPYLLCNVPITRVGQVWSINITYIRMKYGFLYLTAVIDWFSRFVLSWRLSNAMTLDFCIDARQSALIQGTPEVFNSDQGSQFTFQVFPDELLKGNIKISMDGNRRAIDNIFIERFWRTVKYEEVYLKDYASGREA